MAALMFQVPLETARVLQEIGGLPHPETDSHITVVHFGDDIPVEQLGEMLPVIYEVAEDTTPFSVMSKQVSTFPEGDNGVPVIALVESPALHEFHSRMCEALDEHGIEYSKRFPEYKPHVTLAYGPSSVSDLEFPFPTVSWGAHEVVLWGANRGAGKLVVKFPFSVPGSRAAHTKALIKLASWSAPR